MKRFLNALTLLSLVLAPGLSLAEDVTPQNLKGVTYYVLSDSKVLQVEVPYTITLALTKIDSGYGAYLFAKLNADQLPTLADFGSGYSHYTIRYVEPVSYQAINVDLGIGKSLSARAPDYGVNFFTAGAKLTTEEGEKVLSNYSSGQSPQVKINVVASVPTVTVLGKVDLDLQNICSNLKASTNRPTFGGAIASLTTVASDALAQVDNSELRQNASELIFNRCLSLPSSGTYASISDFLKQPVKFNDGSGVEHLAVRKWESRSQPKIWNYSLTVVAQ